MTGLREWFVGIQERAAAAARASGREPYDVRILPVSKTRPIPMIQTAMAAGVRKFGKNHPQDLTAKAQESDANLGRSESGNTGVLTGPDGVSVQSGVGRYGADLGPAPRESEAKPDVPRWVMIGNLQCNKAKLTIAYATELQSLDSLRLAETLFRLLGEAGRELDVVVQISISGETVKHGVEPDVAPDLAGRVTVLPGLRLTGLMGVAAPPSVVGEAEVHGVFARLRTIRDVAAVSTPEASGLFMGMSGNFEVAVVKGLIHVRLGSGLLGQRHVGVVAPADK